MTAPATGILRRLLPRPLWTRLRTIRAQRRLSMYPRRVVRHNYGGHPLEVMITDPVAADWYDHDVPSPPEFALLRRGKLRPGARVFDLGAHQGVVALMLARIVESQGQVVAIEAMAHNARCAEQNRARNRAANVVVLHAAAADRPGTLEFEDGGGSHVATGGGEWSSTTVEAVTVDGLSERFGAPDVVYIDVEGYEQHVLAGAAETLQRSQPDCFVEVHVAAGLEQFGGTIADILAHFPADRYDVFVRDADDAAEFVPASTDDCRRNRRFFLVALARHS
ncbi:MAG: FkbM family methyltransferase [Planctomycetaceae bacterium]